MAATQTVTERLSVEPTIHMKLGHANDPKPPGGPKSNNTLRLRNIKLDPTRALEPARKKLSTIEAQRVMAVFEDAIKRAEIVTALPFITDNIDRFRVSLGSELVDLLNQHERIQGSYKEIREQLDNLLQKRAKQIERIEQKKAARAAKEAEAAAMAAAKADRDFFFEDSEDDEEDVEDDDEENDSDPMPNEQKEEDSDAKQESFAAESKQALEESTVVGENLEDETTENQAEDLEEASKVRSAASSAMSVLSDFDPRIEEAMRNLGLVAQQVSHSCKNILRLFTINPSAMKIVSGVEAKDLRNKGGQEIVDNLNELRDILMNKLLTSPEEESERLSYLEDISKRERNNAAIIERLEKELKEAIDDKEEEIRKKNDVIKRLQTDLHQIEKFSDENIRRTRAEAEKQEIADAKNSDGKTQKLQAEINQLQTQLNNLISEHRELEADLRAKKFKVENEVDNWIQKYDQDLGERQDEYEEIDIVYTEEKKQLLELEERFATLEKEYTAIMEERRVARDKRERAQRELALLVKSATTIQAFWRSYKVRKALKSKNKKKGGKGGKKGR